MSTLGDLAVAYLYEQYQAYVRNQDLDYDEHITPTQRAALRPGEGQYNCFLADRCVGDPRCEVKSAACDHDTRSETR